MVALSHFHFEQPWWLLGLLLPGVLWWLPTPAQQHAESDRTTAFADAHLLPYLRLNQAAENGQQRHALFSWSLIWLLAVLAMAGPRWDYTDIFVAKSNTDVVLLLDMSRSMQVEDVHPNRFGRARQEIQDLLQQSQHLRVGLIGFASVAHVVTPVTEDIQTLLHVLPALSPDLVRLTGSRLSQALASGRRLLLSQPADNGKVLLLISDGGFDESGLLDTVAALQEDGIQLFVLGIGGLKAAFIPDVNGRPFRDVDGQLVTSALEEAGLKALAAAGQGAYWRAGYRTDDTVALGRALAAQTTVVPTKETVRVWHDRFYVPLGLMLGLILLRFMRWRVRGKE